MLKYTHVWSFINYSVSVVLTMSEGKRQRESERERERESPREREPERERERDSGPAHHKLLLDIDAAVIARVNFFELFFFFTQIS